MFLKWSISLEKMFNFSTLWFANIKNIWFWSVLTYFYIKNNFTNKEMNIGDNEI
jgi:hypothetical protein